MKTQIVPVERVDQYSPSWLAHDKVDGALSVLFYGHIRYHFAKLQRHFLPYFERHRIQPGKVEFLP